MNWKRVLFTDNFKYIIDSITFNKRPSFLFCIFSNSTVVEEYTSVINHFRKVTNNENSDAKSTGVRVKLER